jgi:MFS family permease
MEPPAALKHPAFRSLWLAGLVSDAGDWMLFIALPIVVYRMTGSVLGTSFAFLAELGPGIVLAPVAGRLADQLDRRRTMLVLTALQAFTLPALLFVHGTHGLAIVYVVILAQAALAALFDPAKNSLLPTLVPATELVSANSLVALNNGLGRLVGGPLGGLLLAAGDLRAIVVADAVSFGAAALLIARLPASKPALSSRRGVEGALPSPRPVADAVSASRGGFPAVLRRRSVRLGLVVAFVAEIAQGIFLVLFIVFVARRLHGGSGEIGLLRGIQAIGAIGGGLVLTAFARGRSPASLIAGAAMAFGVIDLTIWNAPALTTATGLYVALFIVVGAPGVVLETGLISHLQLTGRDGERGRIFGALGLVGNAGEGIGMIAAGVLTVPLGLITLLDVQGLLYLLAGILAARWLLAPSSEHGSRAPVAPPDRALIPRAGD